MQRETYEIEMFTDEAALSDDRLKELFLQFLERFRVGSKYLYRDHLGKERAPIKVVLEHLSMHDSKLFHTLINRPGHCLDLFREAVTDLFEAEIPVNTSNTNISRIQGVQIVSETEPVPIRRLDASHINRILPVRGIVLSVSSIGTKALILYGLCKTCLGVKKVKEVLPKRCDSCGATGSLLSLPEKSLLQDTQWVKLQEPFEELPTGEVPRHLSALLTGDLVDSLVPGAVATLTGIYTVGNKQKALLKVLGIEKERRILGTLYPPQPLNEEVLNGEEKNEDINSSIQSRRYTREEIISAIAPEVFGHKDIKLALACALFGGTRRTFSDGISVRGEINVLLLGDPGVAKSQMLKFLSYVSPRGVYTSGKGASAAGLTASVCKDARGGFYLEGGALVLADGGLCCIDEFDKMRENDRVAIHEAMEQQTISISKAGIVTSLNSRCAVVAAANPVFGRYDESKAPGENIDFGVTILSRFDLVFLIRDTLGDDTKIARHVLTGTERRQNQEQRDGDREEEKQRLSADQLREYVIRAKKIDPVMEEEAADHLKGFYVRTRKAVQECTDREASRGRGKGSKTPSFSVPITVRQLEAIARVSEALARMEMESIVTCEHVEEAIRLFSESTVKAVMMGYYVEGMPRKEWIKEFSAVEMEIKKILPIGISKPYKVLVNELCRQHSEGVVMRCIDGMVRRERLSLINGGKTVIRMP